MSANTNKTIVSGNFKQGVPGASVIGRLDAGTGPATYIPISSLIPQATAKGVGGTGSNFVWGGVWSANNTYAADTFVVYNGHIWINNNAIIGGVGVGVYPTIDGHTSATGTGNASTTTIVQNLTCSLGDVVYFAVTVEKGGYSVSGVSSTNTASWARVGAIQVSTIPATLEVWAGHATGTLSNEAITMSFSGSTGGIASWAAVVFGVSGLAVGQDPGASVSNSGTNSAPTCGPYTPTETPDLIFGFLGARSASLDTTPPGGWSLVDSHFSVGADFMGNAVFSITQNAAAPQSISVSGSETEWGMVMAAATLNAAIIQPPGTDTRWVQVTSLSDMFDEMFSSSQGAIIYRDSSVWKGLAPGTNGNVLTTGGAGANPSWAAPGSGAISTLTASNSASLAWTGLSQATSWRLVGRLLVPATNSTGLSIQVGTGAGPTYVTSSYFFALSLWSSANVTASFGAQTGTGFPCDDGTVANSAPGTSFDLTITTDNSTFVAYCGTVAFKAQSSHQRGGAVSGYVAITGAITAIKLLEGSGNITSGNATLYNL